MKSILLVDDDHGILDLLGLALEGRGYTQEKGYRIAKAASGEEALKKYSSYCIVLVTDQHLPGMEGTDLLHQMEDVIPYKFMFSSPEDPLSYLEAQNRARERGAEVFKKPGQMRQLLDRIDQLMVEHE